MDQKTSAKDPFAADEPVEVLLDGRGVERSAAVEDNALLEMEGPRFSVRGDLPRVREARRDDELVVLHVEADESLVDVVADLFGRVVRDILGIQFDRLGSLADLENGSRGERRKRGEDKNERTKHHNPETGFHWVAQPPSG